MNKLYLSVTGISAVAAFVICKLAKGRTNVQMDKSTNDNANATPSRQKTAQSGTAQA
ncbi:hypothetical protein [Pseudoalteromonas aurantia]|uniref:hypothetical protein n=1 Tax=Pseudoalteromonas aurantia TaxID=43654 RepID=UPI001487600F|nr:hypothetical protein [Pseudoalteromonas aurantia]